MRCVELKGRLYSSLVWRLFFGGKGSYLGTLKALSTPTIQASVSSRLGIEISLTKAVNQAMELL